jgi:hypothetical protein
MSRTLLVLVLLGAATSGCAYYNAMWSAERFARQARSSEAHGEDGAARGLWNQAAAKADTVLSRHPRSRWADDALVLRLEAVVRSGNCLSLGTTGTRARALTLDGPLTERVDLALAQCAIEAGRPGEAARLLEAPLRSHDGEVRAHGEVLAGRAAWGRGDAAAADEHYARSGRPDAGLERVRLLLATAQSGHAIAVLDSLLVRRNREATWAELFAEVARAAGPGDASFALDRFLARARIAVTTRYQLLLADGDRLVAAGDADRAATQYNRVIAADRGGHEGLAAQGRLLRIRAARAENVAALAPVTAAVLRLGNAGGPDAAALLAMIGRVTTPEGGEGPEFLAAEIARDSLRAPAVAGELFVTFARRRPASLFAPKALVAALPLLPAQADSLLGVLRQEYATSPYTGALDGAISPAYAAAEDSLAQQLGIEREPTRLSRASREAPPVPGARGPWLDQILPALASAAPDAGDVDRRQLLEPLPPPSVPPSGPRSGDFLPRRDVSKPGPAGGRHRGIWE